MKKIILLLSGLFLQIILMAQSGFDPSIGLVASFPFNGNADDVSGNGYNGTVNGAILTTDRYGNSNSAFQFDDNNNKRISLNTVISPIDMVEMTVMAWIKLDVSLTNSGDGEHQTILGQGTGTSSNSKYPFWFLISASGRLMLIRNVPEVGSNPLFYPDDHEWHFVVGTVNGTSGKLYLDGVEIASNDNMGGPGGPDYNLSIGNLGETNGQYGNTFNGKIDDLRLYNYAIDGETINAIYQEEKLHSNEDLLAYYPFNSNANDASGNGNNGVISGATFTTDYLGNPNTAMAFDGIDDFVRIPKSDDVDFGNEDFTISFLINTTSTDEGTIFNSRNTSSCSQASGRTFNCGMTNLGTIRFNLRSSSISDALFSDKIVNDGCWHYVEIRRSLGNIYLKVDEEVKELTLRNPNADYSTINDFYIGKTIYCSGNHIEATMDEFRIYNTGSEYNMPVLDNTPPVAMAKDITVQLDPSGVASITLEQINNGSYDDCNIASLQLDKYDFDCSNIGENLVNLTVMDNSGNTSTTTATVTVEDEHNACFELVLGECTFTIEQFNAAGATEIIAINEVSYANFTRKWGTYVIGIATGIRDDGEAGAWEIHNDCTVRPILLNGFISRTSLLPNIIGIERADKGWKYIPTSISEDGRYIYATAINENGITDEWGRTVAPGTTLDIRFKMGIPFFGRIFGAWGTILCDNLVSDSYAWNYIVIRCDDGTAGARFASNPMPSTKQINAFTVYPNPIKEKFMVALPTKRLAGIKYQIKLYSLTGKEIQTWNFQSSGKEQNIELVLNPNNIIKGLHILVVSTNDGNTYQEKVLIE